MIRSKVGTRFEKLETVTIDNVIYEYVSIQRQGISAIYRTKETFLRIGDAEKINNDLETHKKMEAGGFPVAKIISHGTFEGMAYFIEESLGEEHFGNIFKKETEVTGVISDETFEKFIVISEKFAEAQLKSSLPAKDWSQFEKGIHLDIICVEMSEEKERILAAYSKIKDKLNKFPFSLAHGDFGPFNIYPKGVIDLESTFAGPAPYDVGSVISHLNWFPESKDYEYFQLYTFTPKQKENFLTRIDALYNKHKLPKVSDYLFELDFLKGIWFAVNMERTPKLRQFRRDKIRELLNKFDLKIKP